MITNINRYLTWVANLPALISVPLLAISFFFAIAILCLFMFTGGALIVAAVSWIFGPAVSTGTIAIFVVLCLIILMFADFRRDLRKKF